MCLSVQVGLGQARETGGGLHVKNMVFYTVVGTVVALVAQALGADIMVTLLASLLVPPLMMLAYLIYRYRH